jgi:hypothetical protein
MKKNAPKKAVDYLVQLERNYVDAAIIFRDLPKIHGGIIQQAVGIALQNHPGGLEQTSAKFNFLSGLSTEIDNFFMDHRGQIYLIETKRNIAKVRDKDSPGRSLYEVKHFIEQEISRRTGRRL